MTRPARPSATILSSLRQERLPLALVGVLVFVLQLLLGPAAGLAASVHGVSHAQAVADNGIILCITDEAADSGSARTLPAGHHGSDSCPCGPLCLHALSAAQFPVLPVAGGIISWPPRTVPAVPRLEARDNRPDAAHLTARAIRAPPVLKASTVLA